jgi:hypothetical protein
MMERCRQRHQRGFHTEAYVQKPLCYSETFGVGESLLDKHVRMPRAISKPLVEHLYGPL